jgi:hypothetical protein
VPKVRDIHSHFSTQVEQIARLMELDPLRARGAKLIHLGSRAGARFAVSS